VSDDAAIDTEDGADDLRKENARLARRLARSETLLRDVEQIRDTNARLLTRIRDELEIERRRSHDLLRNVLPQAIIDRLGAGEASIADRHEDVAVVFSDFVGFTEISSQLPVATVVGALNAMFSAFDRSCAWPPPVFPDRPAITSTPRRISRWRCMQPSRRRAIRGRSGSDSTGVRWWRA